MSGAIALIVAFLAFMVPIAIPLFAQSWRTFGLVIVLGVLFFSWATIDLASPSGITRALGTFVLGLMLFGFAAGVIAKFVMLVGRR
jgi:hypothetical protein